MTHRRSKDSLLKRQIRRLMFCNSYQDLHCAETVNMMSSAEILGVLAEPVQVSLVSDVIKGEVLVDSRGQGSFQRV
jgi:hypothetical protein